MEKWAIRYRILAVESCIKNNAVISVRYDIHLDNNSVIM